MSASELQGSATLSGTYVIDGGRPRPPPTRVGRYVVGEPLGSGAMGVVYRAHDPELERAVAIKVVRAGGGDPSSELRLVREAQAMARLRHPNVVPIFDVGPADGAVFVAMPLMEGGTLRRWLRGGERTFDAILDRFVAAGRGLAAAHAAGLIHRDFKPENVLLGAGGETQVSDFGLACLARDEIAPSTSAIRLAAGALTETGAILGTPAYMAPEQLRGQSSDARADQFSFCVALWEGVYGVRPFAAARGRRPEPTRARLDAIAAGPAAPVRRRPIPAWIAPVLARGLDPDPERRWPTMDALLDAIAARRVPRRWPSRLALGLCPAALVLLIAVWSRTPPPPIFRTVQLTHRGDLSNAALSPDGTRLALVAGDSLILRGITPDAEDRVLVEHGIADGSISWSPDGQRLLADTAPELVGVIRTELVDVVHGAQYKLPATGISTFLSSGEIAVTSYRQRSVEIYPVGEHAAAVATCSVPGDYTFIWSLSGMADGTMVVETVKGPTHALVFLRRNCAVRATYAAERITSVALSDTGTVVTLVLGHGFGEIVEISLDGDVVSRRAVNGELHEVIGRRHGADYVLALSLKTHLDRAHGMAPLVHEFSVSGSASFSLAPDGDTLAWIEHTDRVRPRGPLRLSTLAGLARRGYPLVDHAVSASWSPDGRRLAALVDDDAGVAVVVVGRTSGSTRRLPLQHLDHIAQPIWLDDRRVAARSDDLTRYQWFDLETGELGELGDRQHGSTYWLTRSPRDGTLAMWRNGQPGTIDTHTEHLWLMSPGHEARPLHVAEAARHLLLPSWSRSGELLVRVLDTGVVARVALDTGELTPIAQLPAMLLHSSLNHEHALALPDGDLLAVNTEPGMNVSVVQPDDDELPPSDRAERTITTP